MVPGASPRNSRTHEQTAEHLPVLASNEDAGASGISVGLAYAPGDHARSNKVIELATVAAAKPILSSARYSSASNLKVSSSFRRRFSRLLLAKP